MGSFSTWNTKQDSECSISQEEAMEELELAAEPDPVPAPRPENVDKWSFVQRPSSRGDREAPIVGLVLGVLLMTVVY